MTVCNGDDALVDALRVVAFSRLFALTALQRACHVTRHVTCHVSRARLPFRACSGSLCLHVHTHISDRSSVPIQVRNFGIGTISVYEIT